MTKSNSDPALNRLAAAAGHPRHRGDRGEGVISTAIAVLIIAFLGAAMWVGFNAIWDDAEKDIKEQVGNIGDGS